MTHSALVTGEDTVAGVSVSPIIAASRIVAFTATTRV